MMYRIFKAGTFLADITAFWNTWITDEARAKLFYDKSLADSVATTLEAEVVAVRILN